MFVSETSGVVITVKPAFLEGESDPDEGRFIWAYTVEIANTSDDPVQLLEREWHITNALNHTEIVKGEGVVGEQPVIKPGDRFSYTSGAPLTTPSGFMMGAYRLERRGQCFDADIPSFALDSPYGSRTQH